MKKDVVIGLGEIGLPIYKTISKHFPVEGIDINPILNKEKPFSSQHLSTSSNIINYTLLDSPNNATLDTTGFLYWVPKPNQLGSHSFDMYSMCIFLSKKVCMLKGEVREKLGVQILKIFKLRIWEKLLLRNFLKQKLNSFPNRLTLETIMWIFQK